MIALNLLSRYWLHLVLALSVGLLVWYVMNLRANIVEAKNNLQLLVNQLEENRVEYEANLKAYEVKDKEIEVRWKTKYETIYLWRDNNVSCEDAMARFNSTVY